MKIKITAGIFSGEFEAENPPEIKNQADIFFSALKEFPGFSLENYTKPKAGKKIEAPKNADDVVLGTKSDLLAWLKNQEGRHSKNWIKKHAPFHHVDSLLTELVNGGDLFTAEVLYESTRGPKTMQAYHIKGDPEPEEVYPDELESTMIIWVAAHPGYRKKYILENCGIVRSVAAVTFDNLEKSGALVGKASVEKDRKVVRYRVSDEQADLLASMAGE